MVATASSASSVGTWTQICEQSDYVPGTKIVSRGQIFRRIPGSSAGVAFADKSICLEDSLASGRLTAAAFAQTPLYAALPQNHAAAQNEDIAFQDLAKDEWILFARRSHPIVRAAIMDAAQRQGVAPKHAHDILTAQEAIHLVSQHLGVAIVTKPVGISVEGVVIRPLSDPSLSFETCLIMRSDDDSRLANEFGRSFLRRYGPRRLPVVQMELPLPA